MTSGVPQREPAEADRQVVAPRTASPPGSDTNSAQNSAKFGTLLPGTTGRTDNPQAASALRRQALLLSAACAVAASLCLPLWHSARALAGELEARRTRAAGLAASPRRSRRWPDARTGARRSSA